MKTDIVIAGVGGQGILTIAAVVGEAAMSNGLNIKQSEVHGMAQRGGAVVAHLRLSDHPIHSDLIAPGTADIILAVEPLEALRQLPALAPGGVVLANSTPVKNIPNYPPVEEILAGLGKLPHHAIIEADALAKAAGSPRTMNVVMLGALAPFLMLPEACWTDILSKTFARKGDKIVAANLAAYAAGREAAGELLEALTQRPSRAARHVT